MRRPRGRPGAGYPFRPRRAAPKATPGPIVAYLNEQLKKVLTAPDQAPLWKERGLDVVASTPEEFAAHIDKEQKKWGIGVDTDQGFLGNHVLTSATKKVDVGVFNTIKLAKSKAWKGGVDTLFNVKNKGVGYGQVSKTAPNRAALLGKLRLWERNLASGKVKPPRTVK